jgi:hypothetical protein
MTPDSSKFLVSLADMKEYLGLSDDDATRDDRIGYFINIVSEFVDSYCNREILQGVHTEYHDGPGDSVIMLNQAPVASNPTPTVFVDPDHEWSADDKVAEDDWWIDETAGELWRKDGVWPLGRRNVRVIYTAGYTTVPYDLQLSVFEAVAYLRSRQEGKLWGISSKTLAETSVTRFELDFPETVKMIWSRYKRWHP